ncbi:hypothetical protein [Deinococcus aquaticus]|uniref:hypothetical protein n=1 Tax=Deinococcus aquaticus TaxID=328692 RepID=UPI003F44B550
MKHLGLVLYLRDRATLAYHWSKYRDEDVDALLNPPEEDERAKRRGRGYRRFIRAYGLPDPTRVPVTAAQEFLGALKANRVPAWALNIAPLAEIKQEAGES